MTTILDLSFFQTINIRKTAEERLFKETDCIQSWLTKSFSILFMTTQSQANMWYENCFNFLMSFSFWKKISMYAECILLKSDQKTWHQFLRNCKIAFLYSEFQWLEMFESKWIDDES